MCSLFAHQPQRDYESQTRSLRIGGHCTSIRLELSFWDTLEEIAAKEGMSLAKFLTTLHDEVLDHHGEVKNFASLLRCSCMIYRAKNEVAVPVAQRAPGQAETHRRKQESHCSHAPLRPKKYPLRSLGGAISKARETLMTRGWEQVQERGLGLRAPHRLACLSPEDHVGPALRQRDRRGSLRGSF